MIYQSSKLLLLYNSNRFVPTLYGQPFLFLVKATIISIFGRCFFEGGGVGARFNFILFFSQLLRIISPDNLWPCEGTFFHLSDFLRHAVWRC